MANGVRCGPGSNFGLGNSWTLGLSGGQHGRPGSLPSLKQRQRKLSTILQRLGTFLLAHPAALLPQDLPCGTDPFHMQLAPVSCTREDGFVNLFGLQTFTK
jgi:hypothetical protein